MKQKTKMGSCLCCLVLLVMMILPAHADMGPKPSVVISFDHMPEHPCYVTLLSTRYSTGPHSSVYRPGPDGIREEEPSGIPDYYGDGTDYDVFLAFRAYEEQDPDRLYFLQTYSPVEDGGYRWGYYPPTQFKVLLYFPELEAFAVTDELIERYAFDSYFTVDLSELELRQGETVTGLKVLKSYDYTWELISLAVRVVLTIAVELAIAWWFGFRTKGQLRFILLVNLITQLGLNLALNIRAYYDGTMFLIMPFLMMEVGVTAVEWLLYRWKLNVRLDASHLRPGRYAGIANLASMVLGWALAHIVPGIF